MIKESRNDNVRLKVLHVTLTIKATKIKSTQNRYLINMLHE